MLSPPFDVLPVVPICRGVRLLISTPNQWLPSDHPTPPEGRIAIVTDAGCGCGGRGLRQACDCEAQGGLLSVSG
jgi:hypothetical protein